MIDLSRLPQGSTLNPPATAEAIAAAAAALPAQMPAELTELLAQADGVVANLFVIYGCESLPERNATYEVGVYAPGFVTFGDNNGGCALMLRGGADPSPVFLVDHGAMTEDVMEEIAPSLTEWIAHGCPFRSEA